MSSIEDNELPKANISRVLKNAVSFCSFHLFIFQENVIEKVQTH